MSAFHRFAIARLVERAEALDVDVARILSSMADPAHGEPSWAATRWTKLHPEDPDPNPGCCWGSVQEPEMCQCWRPVFEISQAEPKPLASPADLQVRSAMCGDCAFRPGSPERVDEWTSEALYAAAQEGTPFWCHDGMRRPVAWVHPDGREVDASPDDWQPVKDRQGVPYRANGSPGLLCAGWAACAAAAVRPDRRPAEASV